jgi:methylmalonyl-CoA mutase
MKGVDAINFCVPKGISEEEIAMLLKGFYLEAAALSLQPCGNCGIGLIAKTIAAFKKHGADLTKINAAIDANPLKYLTTTGKFDQASFDKLKDALIMAKDAPNLRCIGVSGAALHNAGASAIEELAFAMCMGSEYLAQLSERGLNAAQTAPRMRFTFAVGANYFLEIAKLRAARILWANIVSAYDKAACTKMELHAVTSLWNQTAYDAYVNMLRGTSEAMSAAIAGADSLEVLRFDAAYRAPSDFSERIARNTQIVLKEEARFDQVADPAAGSYYIENLTQSLSEQAWQLFCQIEAKGGYLAAFKAGDIQHSIKESAQKRDAAIASRREILLGTNQYPNFNETIGKETAQRLSNGNACECGCQCRSSDNACCCKDASLYAEPLQQYRGAQAFEALRIKTEAAPKCPQAFMLTFGNLAMCRARAQFACNFFAVAGFKVVDNNNFASIEDGVKAALAAGAEIVVACSSDEEYAQAVPKIAAALAGRALVVVAGEPPCKADLQAQGISHFISVKSNVLQTLQEYQRELGIA